MAQQPGAGGEESAWDFRSFSEKQTQSQLCPMDVI